jgi:hypothetical protein
MKQNELEEQEMMEEALPKDYFGVCPKCGEVDDYINIGRGHWFYCQEHKTKWWGGENIFSSWREQTEDEQRAKYAALDFGSYERVP